MPNLAARIPEESSGANSIMYVCVPQGGQEFLVCCLLPLSLDLRQGSMKHSMCALQPRQARNQERARNSGNRYQSFKTHVCILKGHERQESKNSSIFRVSLHFCTSLPNKLQEFSGDIIII